jgi:hypothetical protein
VRAFSRWLLGSIKRLLRDFHQRRPVGTEREHSRARLPHKQPRRPIVSTTTCLPDNRVSFDNHVEAAADGDLLYQVSAEVQAKRLLLQQLTPQQRAQFDAYGNFSVNVPGRGTFYIFPRPTFNVVQLSTGDCYCCAPEARLPLSDLMLSQKLLLEVDPEQFFGVANRKPNLIADVLAASTQRRYSASASSTVGGLSSVPGTPTRLHTTSVACVSSRRPRPGEATNLGQSNRSGAGTVVNQQATRRAT